MKQFYLNFRHILLSILFICIIFFVSHPIQAKPVDAEKVDKILQLIAKKGYPESDFRDALIAELNTTTNTSRKISLLIQLCVYSLFSDQYEDVKIYSNQLNTLAHHTNEENALDIARVYQVVGEIKIQDATAISHQKLKNIFPKLKHEQAKIHYDIAYAMTAIRDDFPILENQLLRNTFEEIKGQERYSFEEFSILWALASISKDTNEYIELTLKLLNFSDKYHYTISAVTFLYNLQWHLVNANEIIVANKVAEEIFNVAKTTSDLEMKPILLLAYLDTKVRNKETLPFEVLAYIKAIKSESEFWQAWLHTIIAQYYATINNEKEALIYFNKAKAYFDAQTDLDQPDEFIEINSQLAFNKGYYLLSRSLLEKFWWKKYLTVKSNQQNNIVIVRNTLKKVIDKEQKNRMMTEQLLVEAQRTNTILIVVAIVIFILLVFKYQLYLKMKHEIKIREQAEKDLTAAKLKAEEANKTKSDFLSNMSHEIRTPMNGILGSLQVLKRDNLSTESHDIVNIGIASSKNLLSLLNDILDLSKIQSKNISLESIPINIFELFNSIITEFSYVSDKKDVELLLDIDKNEHPFWLVDPVRLRQIIFNLVSNAIKFTPQGTVKVLVVEENNQLVIKVKDTGIGIAESTLNNLFNRYEQADSTITRKFGGTGLGLSISKELTHLMKGEITVQSELNVGSTFIVTLPLKKTDKEAQSKSQNSPTSPPLADKLTILLAEDNKINQKIFTAVVKPTKAIIHIVNDGVETIDALTKQLPDIIFMDIQMPNMDGIEACEIIKAQHPNLPIIALTANVMAHDIEKYQQVGFDKCLGKPVNVNEVYEVIQTFMANEQV